MQIPEKLLYIGILLLPFAFGSVDSETPILSVGLIFLLIPSLLGFYWFVLVVNKNYKLRIWFFVFFCFSILTVISCIFSPSIGPSLYRALVNIEISGVILYILYLVGIYGQEIIYFRVLNGLMASGTVLSLEYICHFIYKGLLVGFGVVFVDRVVGGEAALNWGASNLIAGCLLITSLISLILINSSYHSKSKNIFLYFVFGIQFLAVGLTSSRTVLIILCVFSLFIVFKNKGLKKTIYFFILSGILIVIIFNVFSNYSTGSEWDELINNRIDIETISDMSGRTEIWGDYIQRTLNSFGMPTGYYSAMKINEVSAHNNYLTLFYELGWAGGACFLLLIFSSLVRSFKYPKNILGIVIMAAAINLFVEDLIYLQIYSVYFWLSVSLIYIGKERFSDINKINI